MFDTTHPGSDAQHLIAGQNDQLVVGPFARIAPEARIHQLSRSDLARGRIVARIDSDGAYPERGIAAGVNYIWADSSATGWRSVVVPEDLGAPMASKPLHFGGEGHSRMLGGRVQLPQARWTWWQAGGSVGPCFYCPDIWCWDTPTDRLTLIR